MDGPVLAVRRGTKQTSAAGNKQGQRCRRQQTLEPGFHIKWLLRSLRYLLQKSSEFGVGRAGSLALHLLGTLAEGLF